MNKAELIDAIAAKSGMTKTDSKKALDAFMAVATDALKSGNKISLIGFGTFSIVEREGRTGRNPRTGAALKIHPKKVVKFKPGTELADAVK